MDFRNGKLPRGFELINQVGLGHVVRRQTGRFRSLWNVNSRLSENIQREQDFFSGQRGAIQDRLPQNDAGENQEKAGPFPAGNRPVFLV